MKKESWSHVINNDSRPSSGGCFYYPRTVQTKVRCSKSAQHTDPRTLVVLRILRWILDLASAVFSWKPSGGNDSSYSSRVKKHWSWRWFGWVYAYPRCTSRSRHHATLLWGLGRQELIYTSAFRPPFFRAAGEKKGTAKKRNPKVCFVPKARFFGAFYDIRYF